MVPEANALLAPHSFAQLADDAFSEDLYEAGLHVVDDIASQGFYPDSSLVRHVAAIALVSTCPPQRSKDKTNRSNLARPSNEAALASTAILARLARLLDVDVILDAFPPCSRAAVRGDASSNSSSSSTTNTKGRRSSGDGSEEDGAGMSSRTKTLADEFGTREDVWEVLRMEELGNIKVHGNSSSKSRTREGEQASARSRSKKRVHKEGHEEEEEELGSSAYDREAVWRVLDVLVHCWKGQRTRVEAGGRPSRLSLHLARQFPRPRSSATGKRRRKPDGHEGEDDEGKEEKTAVASTEVGEAIDVVVTGLMPQWTREREQKTRLSRKAKHAERHRRAKTATRLLIELLHLGRLGLLDKDALVRRTAMILDEADDVAIDVILDEMLAETDAAVENALMRAITLYLVQTVNVKTQAADFRSVEMLPDLIVDDHDSESIPLLSRLVLASSTPLTIEKFIAPDVAQAKKSPYDELQKELDVMRDTWTLSTDEAPRKRRWAFSKVSSFSSSAGRVSSNSSSSGSSGGTASALGSSQTRADLPSKTQRSACVEALALTAAMRLAELQARLRAIRFVLVLADAVRRSSNSMGDGLDLDLEGFVDALKTLRDKVVETKISMEGIGKEKIEKLVASFVVGKPRHIAAENYRNLFEDALMGFERGISTLQGWVDVGELWTRGGMDDED